MSLAPQPSRKPVQAATFDLPRPLSVGQLWMPVQRGTGASIIRTSAYRNWLTESGYLLNKQDKHKIIGPYAMALTVTRQSRADLDNCLKATSDVLQAHGIVENDRHCTRIEVTWGDVPGMRVQLFASKPKLGEIANA